MIILIDRFGDEQSPFLHEGFVLVIGVNILDVMHEHLQTVLQFHSARLLSTVDEARLQPLGNHKTKGEGILSWLS